MTGTDDFGYIRALRDEMARQHDGDVGSLLRELAERSRAAGRIVVRLPRREPSPPRARREADHPPAA